MKTKKPSATNPYLSLCLLFLILSQFLVSVSPTEVNYVGATLTFTMTMDSDLNSGDYIKYTIPTTTAMDTTNPATCIMTYPSASTCTCTVSAQTSQCTTTTTGATFIQMAIGPFINPPSTSTLSITVERYTSSASLVESTTSGLSTCTPAVLTSATIVPQNSIDDQIGLNGATALITFTTSQALLAFAQIKVTFPVHNVEASTNQVAMITTGTPTCTGISNLSPSGCTFTSNVLTLSSVTSSQVAAATSFSFSVNSILNPFSAKPWGSFYVATYDSTGGSIETSGAITYTVSTPTTFSLLDLQLATSTIGSNSIYQFIYTVNLPVDQYCQLVIEGPSEVDMVSQFSSAQGSASFQIVSATATDSGNNQVSITGCNSYSQSNSDLVAVSFGVNPAQIQTTSAFKIYFYALIGSTQYIVAQDTSSLTLLSSQLTSGSFTSAAVVATTNTVVQESTSYQVTFTPENNLIASSKIVINFPTTDSLFVLNDNSACTFSSVSGGLVTNPTTCTVSTNVITFTEPFGSSTSYTGGVALSFTLASGNNPTSVRDAGTFIFTTYNTISGADYLVDTYSSASLLTPSIGTITSGLAVTSSSYVTYYSPAQYTISFNPTHQIPVSGKLIITIPTTSIGVYSTSTLTTSAYIQIDGANQYTVSSLSLSTGATSSVLTINEAFPSSAFIPGSSGNTVSVIISGLTNPSSTALSGSFQVVTADADGYSIDQVLTGLSITMNTINSLNSVSVVPGSVINGATNTYLITVNTQTPLVSTDRFQLEFPSQITLPANPSCTTGTALSAVSCTVSGQLLTASLTFTSSPLTSGSSFSFSVPSVINHYSIQTTDAFTNIYTTDSTGTQISQYSGSITLQTTTAATITSASIVQSTESAGTSGTYTLTIQTINQIPPTGAIVVQIPSTATISSSSMSLCQVVYNGITYPMTCTINSNADKVTMTSGLSSVTIPSDSSVQIIVDPIENPPSSTTTSVIVSTYADANTLYIIDEATTGMVPTVLCTSPCLTCQSSDAASCLSCYTIATTNLIYLYSSTCVDQCPTYYFVSGSTCLACMTQCLTCLSTTTCATCDTSGTYPYFYNNNCYNACPSSTFTTSFSCTACVSPCNTCTAASNGFCLTCLTTGTTLIYLSGNTCVDACPAGYYVGTDNVCTACTSPCSTCSGTATTCTACISSYYLYSSQCITSCPSGYIQLLNVCTACTSPCSTCETSVTTCLTCVSGYYLDGNTCTSTCSSGYVPSGTGCVACTSPCNTCVTTQTTCLSCVSGYSLYSSACITSCPSGYISDNQVCTACTSPCATCSGSVTTCLTCVTGYYLYASTCVSSCPSGYVISSTDCVACTSPCATCTSSQTSCTSCVATYFLYGSSTCSSSCPSGYFADSSTNTCVICTSPCATCSTSATTCLTCISNYQIYGTTCSSTCPTGYVEDSGSCVACTSPCAACTSTQTTCTDCVSGYALFGSTCSTACSSGYYPDTTSSTTTCVVCVSPCATCTSASSCLTCVTGYFLYSSACSTTCPSGYYADSSTSTCLACTSPCSTCSSSSACLSCVSGYYSFGSTCGTSCSTGYYADTSTNTCTLCTSPCATCSGSATTCLTCVTSYYLSSSSCVSSCPTGYVEDSSTNTCVACTSPCSACSGSQTSCTACISTYYLFGSSCSTSCATGYYADSSTSTCLACTSPCVTCSGSATTCLSCTTGYYLSGTTCGTTCASGYFTDSSSNTCIACTSPCATCSGSQISCLTCVTSYYLYSSSCYTSCPSGYYADSSTSSCLACTSPCATCSATVGTECLTCITSYYLTSTTCSTSCATGYFGDSVSGTCIACTSPCATCSGSQTSCLTCVTGYYLYGTACGTTCPSGYTATDTSGTGICELSSTTSCTSPCATCSTYTTTCTSCITGYYLTGSTCATTCSAGFFADSSTLTCVACTSPCSECSSSLTTCTACVTGYYLTGSTCSTTCSSGYVGDSTTNTCVACTSPCSTCSSSQTSCTACVSGYYLYSSACSTTCPTGYITDSATSTCLACTSPCATCSGSVTTCSTCVTNYYLTGTTCDTICASGYVGVTGTCVACTSPCATCSGSQTSCLTCVTGYYLYGSTCSTSCPSGTLLVSAACVDCTSPCATCSGTVDTCLTCDSGYYLEGTSCVSTCSSGYVGVSSACVACTSPCATCSGSQTSCSTCVTSYYLYGSTCASTCPSGYVISSSSCLACTSPCATCSSSQTTCSTCVSGYYLTGTSCATTCSSGYVGDSSTNTCVACTTPCQECSGSQTSCSSCVSGYYLFGSACSTNCPTGYYASFSSNSCLACSSTCATCDGSASTCTSCNSNSQLYNSACYTNCQSGYSFDTSTLQCKSDTTSSSYPATPTPSSTPISTPVSTPRVRRNRTRGVQPTSTPNDTLLNLTDPQNATDDLGYDYLDIGTTVPFPFVLIGAGGSAAISLGSLLKEATSLFSTSSVGFSGPSETMALFTQAGLSYYTEQRQIEETSGTAKQLRRLFDLATTGEEQKYHFPVIFAVTIFAICVLILCNVLFTLAVVCSRNINSDENYLQYKREHKKCCIFVFVLSTLINFKIARLLYSRFLGLKCFSMTFGQNTTFFKIVNYTSVFFIIFCILPIIFVDIWGLIQYHWGSQFYIILIETLVIAIIIGILLIMDFKHGKHKPDKDKVLDDTMLHQLKHDYDEFSDKKSFINSIWDSNDLERQRKLDEFKMMLKNINQSELPTQMGIDQQQKIEENLLSNARQRRFSEQLNSIKEEDDEQYPNSYPVTPRTQKRLQEDGGFNPAGWMSEQYETKTNMAKHEQDIRPPSGKTQDPLKRMGTDLFIEERFHSEYESDREKFTKVRGRTQKQEQVQIEDMLKNEEELTEDNVESIKYLGDDQDNEQPKFKIDSIQSIKEGKMSVLDFIEPEEEQKIENVGNQIIEDDVSQQSRLKSAMHTIRPQSKQMSVKFSFKPDDNQESQSSLSKISDVPKEIKRQDSRVSKRSTKMAKMPGLNEVKTQQSLSNRQPTEMKFQIQSLKNLEEEKVLSQNEDTVKAENDQSILQQNQDVISQREPTRMSNQQLSQGIKHEPKLELEPPLTSEDLHNTESSVQGNVYTNNQEKDENTEEDELDKEIQKVNSNYQALQTHSSQEKASRQSKLSSETPPDGIKSQLSKHSKVSRQISEQNKQISQLSKQQTEQEEEEKKLIDEMRSQAASMMKFREKDQSVMYKDAISKLSKYEEELNIQHTDPEIERRQSLMRPGSKLSNLGSNQQHIPPDGRISAMIRKFEEDNPDLIQEEDELDDVRAPSPKMEKIVPQGIDYPANAVNRNFNENDILGEFERDNRGNVVLLENKSGQIVDKKGRPVNEKGFLVDGKAGNIVDREQGRLIFRKEELDDTGDLPAPFSIERYNFNPLEILGNVDLDSENMRPLNSQESQGQLVDKSGNNINRSAFLVDKDGNLVDRGGRKRFDRRQLVKNDDMPQLLNYKGKKFDIKDVMGIFNHDQNSGDVIITKDEKGGFIDKFGRQVNQRGYLIDSDGNVIDRKGKEIFEKEALSKNGEFPKIFPFSKFNISSIQGDFEVDPLGNPILQKDPKKANFYRDNKGKRVNQKGYLIDDHGNIIDHNMNQVFSKQVLTSDYDIPKVFRKGILRKDTGDSFSRIMSEIEELERKQGISEFEHEYPPQFSPIKESPKKTPKITPRKKKLKLHDFDEDDSGGNTSFESLMEDTPSNYNIANQRFDMNYYEVEEILEDGQEEKYDENGKLIKKNPKKKIKRIRQKGFKEDQPSNRESNPEVKNAFGEKKSTQKQIVPPPNAKQQMHQTQTKLSAMTNSISGFYRDSSQPEGISSRMKESEVARKIPNFKDKQKSKDKLRAKQQEQRRKTEEDESSDNSLYSEQRHNYQQMMTHMEQGFLKPGKKKKQKGIKGMETIYLQRLEPSVGKYNPRNNPPRKKPKFRELQDRVYEPERQIDDLQIKNGLESVISQNYKYMVDNVSQVPQTQRYLDINKVQKMKKKFPKPSKGSSSRDKASSWGDGEVFDMDGQNIFAGNKRNYSKEFKSIPKVKF